MQRRHDPTYYWATRRLPAPVRPATHALYGYVRIADELVDGPARAADPAARIAALDAWEAELARPAHPVACAWADAAHRHALPTDELHAYMGSMRVDCGPVRMDSWDALETYMDGSAGTVGRIMARLLGVDDVPAFGALGRTFQLTNFLRDVREDTALGRSYLPVADADPGSLRGAVAEGVQRARAGFATAEPAVAGAPRRMRPGIRVAIGVYERVLDRIEAVDFDVMGRRTAAPPWHVAAATIGALRA